MRPLGNSGIVTAKQRKGQRQTRADAPVNARQKRQPGGVAQSSKGAAAGGFMAKLTAGGHALPLGSAAVAGALMAVQGTLNAVLSKFIGLLETSFLAQVLGGVAAAVLLYVLRLGSGSLGALRDGVPWYTLLAGPIGLAIIYLVAYGISQSGVAAATTAIIIGQVSTAVLIDSLGLFGAQHVPFCWTKVLGIALLAAAGWIMLRR